MWFGAIAFQNAASGSSGIASETLVTLTSVAYVRVLGPSDRM